MMLSIQTVIGIILEVVVVGVILISAIIGLKRGFLKSVLSVFTTSIVIVISVFTAKWGAKLLEKIFGFVSFMGRQMSKVLAGMADGVFAEVMDESTTVANANAVIDGSGVFGPLKSLLKKAVAAESNNLAGNTIANIGGRSLGAVLSIIIAGIIIFLIFKLVLFLLSKLFENLTANKVLGTPDKVLGIIFGLAKGLIIIFVYAVVLIILTLIPTVNNFVSPVIQKHTFVTKMIYNVSDKIVEKTIIDKIDDWVNQLWENRSSTGEDAESDISTAAPQFIITVNEVA